MIVIHKKRIEIIIASLFIAIFSFAFQIAKSENQSQNNIKLEQQQQDTIATTATPVSGKTIVVDARASVCQTNGAQSSSRYNRGRNKSRDSIKITELVRK